MLRGFFSDHRHLARHFTWLTNVDDLTAVVDENLHKQIGNLHFLLFLFFILIFIYFSTLTFPTYFDNVYFSGYLLQYLLHVDQSMEFQYKLAGVDLAVETEYDRSRVFKDINILVS